MSLMDEDVSDGYTPKKESSQVIFELILLLQKIENVIGSLSLSDALIESPQESPRTRLELQELLDRRSACCRRNLFSVDQALTLIGELGHFLSAFPLSNRSEMLARVAEYRSILDGWRETLLKEADDCDSLLEQADFDRTILREDNCEGEDSTAVTFQK